MDSRPLATKALECAVKDILLAKDREEANSRFIKWSIFKDDLQFKNAIQQKQSQFKS